MNNLPVSAALHASASTPQAAPAPSEQAERAGLTPSGVGSFKDVLRKELDLEPDASASKPDLPVPQKDLATDAQSRSAAKTAQAAATVEATLAMLLQTQAGATAEATLAMLLHAQAGAAAAQSASQTMQAVPLLVPAGSPGSPRVELADAVLSAMPGQQASQAKPGSIESGWMAGAARRAVFDLAATSSAAAQSSLADGRQPLFSRLTGFAMPGDAASIPLAAPRQEFRLDASADASLPVTSGSPATSAPQSSGAPSPSVVQAQLHARVGDVNWNQGLGERLVWMAGQHQQVVQLHLNPPDLGPLTITLTLERDQASAQFVCAQLAVREAIESAMPRLRDMLADSGITLGNVNVGAQAFSDPAGQQDRAHRGYPGAAQSDPDATELAPRPLRGGVGLVDTFA